MGYDVYLGLLRRLLSTIVEFFIMQPARAVDLILRYSSPQNNTAYCLGKIQLSPV